jgi:hypothetical protein
MIRSAVYCVKLPSPDTAMIDDCPFDKPTLLDVQNTSVFGHPRFGLLLPNWIRKLPALAVLDPAAFVAG